MDYSAFLRVGYGDGMWSGALDDKDNVGRYVTLLDTSAAVPQRLEYWLLSAMGHIVRHIG